MAENTTIERQLAALGEGETLVILTQDKNGIGYWLGVGDVNASNVWAITRPELDQIVRLGASQLGLEIVPKGEETK